MLLWLTAIITTIFTILKNGSTYVMEVIKFELLFNWIGVYGFLDDLFHKHKCNLSWLSNQTVSRAGHVAIVTGGARGIGFELVKLLVDQQVHVVVGCRDRQKAEERFSKYANRVTCEYLDIGELESVRKFADFIKQSFPKVNYLINNAGIMCPPYRETSDGHESQFAVNYLGHFLLTHLLMPQLQEAGKHSEIYSRIVNVTSVVHYILKDFKPEQLLEKKPQYIPVAGYSRSKLAQILFTYRLQNLLHENQLPVECVSVHPGVVNTDIFNGQFIKTIAPFALKLFKSPEKGAFSVLYASLYEPLKKPGKHYISNCSRKTSSSLTQSELLQNNLFNFTTNLLNISNFF